MPNSTKTTQVKSSIMHNNNTQRILIFGNAGSGKTTLAKNYADKHDLPHLDLDELAWLDTKIPERKPLKESARLINAFVKKNKSWVIEGCYSDLLDLLESIATKMIFLNPGVDTCISNCKARPWEPHKYKTAEAQNKNLGMLLQWVSDYPVREDEFSLSAHKALFERFKGNKIERTSNERK
nr:NB-ARC domain-containing protein [Bathymodiolus thermophilus thioautotrophic gill symbiont]